MSISDDTLSHMRTRITRLVRQKTEFGEQLATLIAGEIIDTLLHDYRGERIYISPSLAERDASVLLAFDGRNHARVCEQHDISRSTLYRILQKRGNNSNPQNTPSEPRRTNHG